jgi:hypothetical protein
MQVRIRYEHWIPTLMNVEGIALYPFVLLSMKKKHVDYSILRHEFQHIQQCRDLGFFFFYISYGIIFVYNLLRFGFDRDKAYHAIEYEVEAYAKQNDDFTPEQIKELENCDLPKHIRKRLARKAIR